MSLDVPALKASGLHMSFGGVQALAGVDLAVAEGEIRGLIGPNGAGKTTLLNVLSGLTRPDRGSVQRAGVDVTGWGADRVVRRAGMVRTFQTVRLFASMTVAENVLVATGGTAAGEAAVAGCLDRVGLGAERDRPAGQLAFGLQRRVELARALATGATLLLLDEPAAGLNTSERGELAELILEIRAGGVTVLLIEHQMDLVSATCDRLTVLDFGRVIAEGSPADVVADPGVVEAFLGAPVPTLTT